jgi:hypothetical protein
VPAVGWGRGSGEWLAFVRCGCSACLGMGGSCSCLLVIGRLGAYRRGGGGADCMHASGLCVLLSVRWIGWLVTLRGQGRVPCTEVYTYMLLCVASICCCCVLLASAAAVCCCVAAAQARVGVHACAWCDCHRGGLQPGQG